MSKFDEVIDNCKKQMADKGIDCDEGLLTAIAKSLGPSIYNKDSGTVATADKGEMETVRKNFIGGKLGVTDDAAANAAVKAATDKIGSSTSNKLRPVYYYLLTKELGKESVFG